MKTYRNIKVRYLRLYNKMGAVCWLVCKYKMSENSAEKKVGDSGGFPIGQSRTLDLSKLGIPEGALVTAHVGVIAGKDNSGTVWFVYSKDCDATASYIVTGTTLHNGVLYRPDGYNHDNTIVCSNPDWMSKLPDDIHITQISMIGTHDTMALEGTDDLVCQSLPLHTQLNVGIRMLDIRCKNEEGKLKIYHRNKYEGMELKDVLETIVTFFKAHPTETILMRLGNEKANVTDEYMKEFDQLFMKSYWTPYEQYFWHYSGNNSNPQLSEIRNKIVLMPAFSPKSISYGISWASVGMQIQDAYKIGAIWGLYEKWKKVQTHLENANKNENRLYLNFLSGTYGVLPYFVASGQSSPQTSAPLLLTGKLDSDDWPDFPRMLGSIAYEGTNNLIINYIRDHPEIKHAGIILCDFPGADLINTIIRLNDFK